MVNFGEPKGTVDALHAPAYRRAAHRQARQAAYERTHLHPEHRELLDPTPMPKTVTSQYTEVLDKETGKVDYYIPAGRTWRLDANLKTGREGIDVQRRTITPVQALYYGWIANDPDTEGQNTKK